MTATLDRARLRELTATEDALFAERHPRCRELFERGGAHMLDGVPDELDGAPRRIPSPCSCARRRAPT